MYWSNWIDSVKRMKKRLISITHTHKQTHTHTNSKCIKGYKIRPDTLKPTEAKVGNIF